MGLIETEAIILRTYHLGEADKIVICLTKDTGIIRGVARGARRLKSKFGASLEPFTLINITFFQKDERELVSIRQAEILRSFFNLAPATEAIAVLEYLAQLAIDFAPPHQTEEYLFRMVRATISAAYEHAELIPQLAIYYELWILRLAGFLPDLSVCGKCLRKLSYLKRGAYANYEGVLFCHECKRSEFTHLDINLYALMLGMRKLDATTWAQSCASFTAQDQKTISQIIRQLIIRVLEKAPHVKLLSHNTQRLI